MCSRALGPVALLAAALDGLADEDLTGLAGPAVVEALRVLLPLVNRLDAQVARLVRRGEVTGAAEHDGAKTMASWLRGHARLSPSAAGQLVRVGRTLEHLPAVAAGAAAGEISADHVAVMAPVVAPANVAAAEAQSVSLPAVDALLAQVAAGQPHADLAAVVHHYLERLDPDGPEPDPTDERRLTWAKHADGSGTGRFHLDAVGMEKFQAAIESIMQTNRPAGDDRSHAQRAADALVQLCDNLLASGTLPFTRTVKPHLAVTIGINDLVDPGKGPSAATAGFGAVLSAARARWAACDPDITRIVLGPDGQPLDVGRTVRLALPPAQGRRAPRQDMRLRWLQRSHLVVRGPPPPRVGSGRGDLAGQFRAALRMPPHQGPPRLPNPARSGGPLAHLPPRRQRDPHPRAITRSRRRARPHRLSRRTPHNQPHPAAPRAAGQRCVTGGWVATTSGPGSAQVAVKRRERSLLDGVRNPGSTGESAMTQQISQPGQPAAPYAPPGGPYVPTSRYGEGVPQQPGPYGRPGSPYGQQPGPQYGAPQPPTAPPTPPYGYGRPMGQPMAPAPKKRRTGLIVGAIVGVLVLAGLAVGAIFLFGSKSLDTAEAQTKIADLTRQQIGSTPTDVSCPKDVGLTPGTTFQCTATLDGQPITYTVTETDDKGNVRVDSDNNLILVSKVEESVAQQVGDEAGVQVTATCDTGGKKVLVDSQDKPIHCTVVNAGDSTDTLDVQATVDDQGNVSWTAD